MTANPSLSARMRRLPLACLLAGSVALGGCAATTLRSGRAPGETAPGYDARWHPAFLFGAVSFRDAYDLRRICKDGWAEVSVAPDPFTVLAGLLTAFIYSPSRLTIVCAADPNRGPPSLRAYRGPSSATR